MAALTGTAEQAVARTIEGLGYEFVDAERLSGYKVGGISPLGQKKRIRTFFDDSALTFPFIVINGGQRGLQIKAKAQDLMDAVAASAAAIATEE